MRRERGTPRPDWQRTVAEQGLAFGTPGRDGSGNERPYWDESVHYVFEMDEILSLEADVEVLQSMCLSAVDHVVTTERFRDFALPEWCWEQVAQSWRRSDPHLYGRFDLRYDGSGPAKLLEYNADTPTSLLEASILQWHWLQDVHPGDDQWNSLHEKLVERWGELKGLLPSSEVHVTWSGAESTGEDHITVGYLQETAAEAGLDTVGLSIEDIGWDSALDRFVDLEEAPISTVFKLYPWEWMLTDEFGKHVTRSLPETLWLEPLWKTLLSNKALLAVLWEMYPGHPNPAARLARQPRDPHRVRPQAPAGARGRQHRDRRPRPRDRHRRRLRRRGLRLPDVRPAARVRRVPALPGRLAGR